MRKLLLLFTFLSVCITQINAQKKSIKASPAKMEYHTPASKAAASDPNVQEIIQPKTNQVFYLRKNVCEITGKVSYDTLEYCSKSKRFVSITPIKEVRSSCLHSKGIYSTQMVKAPVVNKRGSIEYLRAQKAACSSATTKVKTKVRLVRNGGQ